VGDLDGDGFEDVAAEAYHFGLDLYTTDWLVLGRDGVPQEKRLGALSSYAPDRREARGWMESVAAVAPVGDVNGDGIPDMAMGVCGELLFGRDPPTGVWLFSLGTWEVLKIWRRSVVSFGRCVALVGDVDGDERSDFAATNDYGPASVEVLSMSVESSLWVKELPIEGGFIVDLVAIGDADGDGLQELAARVGGRWSSPTTLFVLAGRDGSVLWSRSGALPGEWDYVNIASAGDVDVDGVPDLWAVIYEPELHCTRVELLSGRDGATLRSADRSQSSTNGIKACADLDGDGVSELVVPWRIRGENCGRVRIEVISSRTLTPLCSSTLADGDCVAALRTPYGVRIVTNGQSGLQAFDLVRVEAGR
jgi:hypothetical protein